VAPEPLPEPWQYSHAVTYRIYDARELWPVRSQLIFRNFSSEPFYFVTFVTHLILRGPGAEPVAGRSGGRLPALSSARIVSIAKLRNSPPHAAPPAAPKDAASLAHSAPRPEVSAPFRTTSRSVQHAAPPRVKPRVTPFCRSFTRKNMHPWPGKCSWLGTCSRSIKLAVTHL
jgi:hypothetical protein